MSITIKDIARIAGVSYSTVSKALNDSPLVKPKTKAHIIAVARQMGYQPNMVAKSLVSKRSNIIGVVWPRVERFTWSSLVTEVNNKLTAHSYNLLLSINPVESAIAVFNQFRVDAILIFREYLLDGMKVKPSSTVPILHYGSPIIPKTPTINVNRRKAMSLAVEHLARLGHSRISYIGDLSPADPTQREKVAGYKDAANRFHLAQHADIMIDSIDNSPDSGYLVGKKLLSSPFRPTAIVIGSYGLSLGVFRALNEEKVRVPDDLSIVSYDNIPQMVNFAVPLTVVGASVEAVANAIVGALINLVECGDGVADYTEIDVELVARKSCASPRAD